VSIDAVHVNAGYEADAGGYGGVGFGDGDAEFVEAGVVLGTVRTQNSTVPLSHENIGAVHESVRYAHVALSLLAVFEFLEEFEITGRDYRFAGG